MRSIPKSLLAIVAAGAALVVACKQVPRSTGPTRSVAALLVSPKVQTVKAGATVQLQATVKGTDGSTMAGVPVAWRSLDPVVATVSTGGLVTAIAPGTSSIIASAQSAADTSQITVASTLVSVASVAVSVPNSALTVGQTTQATAVTKDSLGAVLTGRAVNWSTSAANVATVSATGLVTAVAAGSAQISATSEGKTGSASVTVTVAPVASVVVSLPSSVLTAGQTMQATAVTKDASGTVLTGRSLTWSSSDPTVATVSATGLVTAVAAGSAQISATSQGITGSAPLSVTAQSSGNLIPGVTDLNCVPTSAPPIPAPLRTFYVDAQAGSDGNSGTSTSTPWQTLDKASSSVRAGDLVYLKGTFTNQWLHPGASGTATAKIVFKVWPGATAVLNGGKYGATVVLDNGLNNIVVDGLEITNIANPIQLSGGANNNWFRNLYVHDITSQISIRGASDNRLEDSRIERCGSESANAGDCIWMEDGANRNVIARNVLRQGGHSLLDLGGDNAGIAFADDNVISQNDIGNAWAMNMGMYAYARRTIVECNRIHDATSTSTVNYPRAGINISSNDNIVRFNLIYNNKADGIQIQGYDFQGIIQSPSGNQVYQNTVWGNGGAGLEISQQQSGTVSNNSIQNNIFWNDNLAGATNQGRYYQGGSYDVWVDLYSATSVWPSGSMNGNVIQNNILGSSLADAGKQWMIIVMSSGDKYYTLAQAQSSFPTSISGNREVDPLLNTSDFSLQAGSPAIDAGQVIFAGQKYNGAAPDLGAREKP